MWGLPVRQQLVRTVRPMRAHQQASYCPLVITTPPPPRQRPLLYECRHYCCCASPLPIPLIIKTHTPGATMLLGLIEIPQWEGLDATGPDIDRAEGWGHQGGGPLGPHKKEMLNHLTTAKLVAWEHGGMWRNPRKGHTGGRIGSSPS